MRPLYRTASLVLALGLTGAAPTAAPAQEAKWPPEKAKASEFNGRKLDTYQHGVKKGWGYADAQKDTLQEVFPQGGGFGGGGMGGMGGGAGGGKGGGKGGPPGGGGMGGQKADPDKPFASERDKKSLEALIAVLEGKGQK